MYLKVTEAPVDCTTWFVKPVGVSLGTIVAVCAKLAYPDDVCMFVTVETPLLSVAPMNARSETSLARHAILAPATGS